MTSDGRVPGGQVDRDAAAAGCRRAVRRSASTTTAVTARVRRRLAADARWCWSRGPTSCAPTSRRASRRTEQAEKLRDPGAARAPTALVGRLLDATSTRARRGASSSAPTPPTPTRRVSRRRGARARASRPVSSRSTTTQRDGFVNITDVAPTVLTYFGLERPDAMEGRRMETGEAGGVARRPARVPRRTSTRTACSATASSAPSMGVVLGVAMRARARDGALVDRCAAPAVRCAGSSRSPRCGSSGFLDATYLAGPLHFGRHGGAAAYWAFVLGVGAGARRHCACSWHAAKPRRRGARRPRQRGRCCTSSTS